MLLYDSKLQLFLGKLKLRWTGPFIIHKVHPNGSVDLLNSKDSRVFKVNGQRLKPMQYSSQQTRRRSPSLILLELERLPCVGMASVEAQKPSNFCCEFYLVYCKFYLCFSLICSLVLITISHSFMPILIIFGFMFCKCCNCRS